MEMAVATGVIFAGIPRGTAVTVRAETTCYDGERFSTISLADDDSRIMLQCIVTPEVKRLLREVCK